MKAKNLPFYLNTIREEATSITLPTNYHDVIHKDVMFVTLQITFFIFSYALTQNFLIIGI
jgi:hypothetical protein